MPKASDPVTRGGGPAKAFYGSAGGVRVSLLRDRALQFPLNGTVKKPVNPVEGCWVQAQSTSFLE